MGIRDRAPVPTLADFVKREFLPHIETRFADQRKTRAHYTVQLKHLLAHSALAGTALDAIKAEMLGGFIEKLRQQEYQISSINRALQVLRRVLMLAAEWGKIDRVPVKIQMHPGENRRDRVLSGDEEKRYLKAAGEIGDSILEAYKMALCGIRAKQRGEQPPEPSDPYPVAEMSPSPSI